jgi:hypothetical protein
LEGFVILRRTKELGLGVRVDRLDLREQTERGIHIIAACRAQLKAGPSHRVLRDWNDNQVSSFSKDNSM